jgi:hypothetical protein
MCTLSIISVAAQDGWTRAPVGLRIVASRDEQRTRPPALAPRWRPLDQRAGQGATRAIWPTDPRGGGTWIAAADSGLVLCLLNLNLEPEPPLPPDLVSRGRIIPSLISANGARAAIAGLRQMNLSLFAPFRLAAVEAGAAEQPTILVARWDREELTVQPIDGTPMCLASSGLGDSLVQSRRDLFDELVVQQGQTPQAQDRFHLHHWPEQPEVSVLMSRPDARTVSITTVEVSAHAGLDGVFGVRMGYQPILEGGRLGLQEALKARPVVLLGRGG